MKEWKPRYQGAVDVIMSTVNGIYETIDIMFFVLILGGCLGILTYSGAFTAGIGSLSRATQGKEYILIVAMTFLISLGRNHLRYGRGDHGAVPCAGTGVPGCEI